jgi:Universal stress protein family
MGSRRLPGVSRLLLGSVSRAVVGAASCPVLVVHESQDGSQGDAPGRVVLAVDDGGGADVSAATAAPVLASDSEVMVLHVRPPGTW